MGAGQGGSGRQVFLNRDASEAPPMSVFRKLFATEADKYKAHLLRLDRDDRYMRFASYASDDRISRFVDAIDWGDTVVIGFFDCGELFGAAEARIAGVNGSRRAELAFSIEKRFQGRGVGGALMRRALTVVRNRGVRVADIMCLLENCRMRRLGSHYANATAIDSGEVEMRIDLDQSDQMSWLFEAIDDGESVITTLLDQLQYPDARAHVPFHGWAA